MEKNIARKNILELRKKLDSNISSKKIIEEIINSNILNDFNNIGIYYPIGNEINIMNLIDKYPNKNFYLPITREEIHFIKYNKNDKLIKAKFNTYEPIGDIVNRDSIECFIIPCVGISNDNKRLGYGKGYYDRYLSGYNGLKIGVCYKELVNLDIEMDDFDLKLDVVFKW